MNFPETGRDSKLADGGIILKTGRLKFRRSTIFLGGLLLLIGATQFLVGITGDQPQRAWQAYLVNFMFFTGISSGAILFVAILNMTHARWGRPLKRLAEGLGAFLPVSFLLFWVLYAGREEIFPWIKEPVPGKEAWLNAGFLFARNGAGLFLLTVISLVLIYFSVREDRRRTTPIEAAGRPAFEFLDEREEKNWRAQMILSPILGISYAVVLSLLAFDLIMSLDPHWHSTLFGAYYFIGSFYTALAALIILSALLRKQPGFLNLIQPGHFHDLGKLLLGFCLITGDFFYSQFLVIWYGNLPEETRYVILRVRQNPWEPLAWAVLGLCFALPFIGLLSRKIKLKPPALAVLSAVILVGMWLERFLLIAPSLWKGQDFFLGRPEISITAGFLGLLTLSFVLFFRMFSPLPFSDPLFRKSLEEAGKVSDPGIKHG